MRLLLLIMTCVAVPAGAQTLLLSDIHFDPFADPAIACRLASSPVENWTAILQSPANTKFPPYGSDTTYPLFVSTLASAKQRKYDHVIVTGDFLRHNFQQAFQQAMAGCKGQDYSGFVIKTMRFVNLRIREAFPTLPVINVLGNNDSTCGDYEISPDDPHGDASLLAALAKEWRVSGESFRIGGYYSIPSPVVPRQEFVVLNDIFWSAKYKDACGPQQSDPGGGEMSWLAWTLFRLQSEKKTAVLIMHIPPGIDAYSSSQVACPSPAVTFWNPAYGDQFMALLQKYPGVVTGAFAGHTHMDDFRVFAGVGMHIIPAVTPDFGNNPAFQVGSASDFTTVYFAKQLWQPEYTFSKAYGFPFSEANLQTLAGQISSDPKVRGVFSGFYAVSATPSPITAQNWKFYSCAQTEMGAAGYNRCACSGQ